MIRVKRFFESLWQSCETILRIFLFAKFKLPIDKQKNKTLLVLGNGPSLNNSLEELKMRFHQFDSICVNFFPSTPKYEECKPNYFITSAPELWRDNVEDIYIKLRNKLYNDIADKTSWPLEFFIAHEAKKNKFWQEIIKKNKNIKITYYNILPAEGFTGFRHFVFNRRLGLPRPHNVLIPSIMMGIHKGYCKIILLGSDHSWLPQISVDEANNVLVNQQHFYDENSSKPLPMRKVGQGQRKLHEVLEKFQVTFKSYFIIKEYAEQKKVQILNATPGSYIDAFARIRLDEVALENEQ